MEVTKAMNRETPAIREEKKLRTPVLLHEIEQAIREGGLLPLQRSEPLA
jgi:hypothetical protein